MNFDLEYEEAKYTHDCEWCTFMGSAYRRTDRHPLRLCIIRRARTAA